MTLQRHAALLCHALLLRHHVCVRSSRITDGSDTSTLVGEINSHSCAPACAQDNIFFADDTDPSFVHNERRPGTLELGWTVSNNSILPVSQIKLQVADTPAIQKVIYDDEPLAAHVWLESRINPPRPTTLLWSLDGSWPQAGAHGTASQRLSSGGEGVDGRGDGNLFLIPKKKNSGALRGSLMSTV